MLGRLFPFGHLADGRSIRTSGPRSVRWLCRRAPWHFDAASVTIITAPGEARVQILFLGEPMPTLRGNGCDMAFVERGASAP
jgi:hypothetical protein